MQRVLILGGGINGAALARELLLSGTPVTLVDRNDLAFGATAYSSRLIHGGLRYLEHGEFDLVRESLAERTRLLRLAPQFVRPLELFIPTGNRFGGLAASAARFVGWPCWPATARARRERGAWLVRAGLSFYDRYASDPTLPRHSVRSLAEESLPVDRDKYRWLCSYHDAQVTYPERLVLAFLEDARRLAVERGVEFRVLTYHEARLRNRTVEITPVGQPDAVVERIEPAAIVNATGAWVDLTLQSLAVSSRTLMGGTKGSHLFTFHEPLRRALAGRGIYAEAGDGRPIFITPLAATTLVGTTDVPFSGCPAQAVATDEEIDYLLGAVNTILPDIKLSRADIDFHYSGVRPLPHTDHKTPAAITRRHWIERNPSSPVPLYSIIGGKLTTCRSLAESSARTILAELGRPVTANSRQRVIPGGEDYPHDAAALDAAQDALAKRLGVTREQIDAVWQLVGTRTEAILSQAGTRGEVLPGTLLPLEFVRWMIRHEWVRTVGDLVERRLMLLYHQRLTRAVLRTLAELLVEEGQLPIERVDSEVDRCVERLRTHFGKQIAE